VVLIKLLFIKDLLETKISCYKRLLGSW